VDVTPAAYAHVFQSNLFWRSYANGVFLTVAGSVFTMLVSLTGAYALSKRYLPGVRFFNFFVVFTMWFSAGTIPIFLNLQGLNLLNYGGLIIGFGISAFSIIVVRSAFAGVPSELQEAARIDGANEFQNFFHVSLPSIKPAIATVWLLAAINRWNGFFWAMIIIREERWIPLQVYLRTLIVERTAIIEGGDFFLAEHSTVTIIYAVIVLSIVPILAVFPFMQRFFKRGIMEGGLKG
jgi:putative aldouronate transport system permease protein